MRNQTIDAWKGLLILLVVVGHVVGGGCHLATGTSYAALRMTYLIIYSFHMSAFFFIAGIMWREKEFGEFILGRARRLLIPYVCVGLVSICLHQLFGDGTRAFAESGSYYQTWAAHKGGISENLISLVHAGGWPNGQGFRCNSVLWFLPCMFVVQICFWPIRHFLTKTWSLIVLLVILLALDCVFDVLGFAYWPWGANKIPRYLMYMIIGNRVKDVFLAQQFKIGKIVGAMGVSCMFGSVYICWMERLVAGPIVICLMPVMALLGIVLGRWIIDCSGEFARHIFATLGFASMGIMLWHKFFVVTMQLKLPFVRALYASGLIGSILASAGVILLSTICSIWLCGIWNYVVCHVSLKLFAKP